MSWRRDLGVLLFESNSNFESNFLARRFRRRIYHFGDVSSWSGWQRRKVLFLRVYPFNIPTTSLYIFERIIYIIRGNESQERGGGHYNHCTEKIVKCIWTTLIWSSTALIEQSLHMKCNFPVHGIRSGDKREFKTLFFSYFSQWEITDFDLSIR